LSGTQSAQTVFAPLAPLTRQPLGLLFTSTGAFSFSPLALPPPPVATRPGGQSTVAALLPAAVADCQMVRDLRGVSSPN